MKKNIDRREFLKQTGEGVAMAGAVALAGACAPKKTAEAVVRSSTKSGEDPLETGKMEYCNCGHNPPVVFSDGEARFLTVKANTPLGIDGSWCFEGEEIADVREQPFLFYTDGLNEAENPVHEQFGNDRILQVLRSAPFRTAQDSIEQMLASLTVFVDGAEASDDLTMLCLKNSRKG